MGIRLFGISGGSPSGERKSVSGGYTPKPPEPNPARYEILDVEEVNGWCICEIIYFGCTTYEGRKLLVYPCIFAEVRKQKLLDPHFSKGFSPVARFEPTPRGKKLARLICKKR